MRFRNVYIAQILIAMLVIGSCGGNQSAVTRPNAVLQTATGADVAIKAADIALSAIDAMTPSMVPRSTTIAIAKALEQVGKGGQSVAALLDAYAKSRGANDWTKVAGAILGVEQDLDAALAALPEPSRTQVRGILQPVTAALLTILARLPIPGVASAAITPICQPGQHVGGTQWSNGMFVGMLCFDNVDARVKEFERIVAADIVID